jgi:hypothetical protein
MIELTAITMLIDNGHICNLPPQYRSVPFVTYKTFFTRVNRTIYRFFIVTLTGLSTLLAQGQTGGNTVFTSLDIQPSARVAAAGGFLPSVRDGDLSLAIYNPALLDTLSHQQTALSYVNYFAGVNLGFAGYAHHLDSSNITLAATMQYVNYGQFIERDAAGFELGSFSAGDYALILGAATPIDSLFTAGINLKGIYSNIAGFNAWGVAVDFGVTYHNPLKRVTAALVARNIGHVFGGFTDGERDSISPNVMVSVTHKLKHAPFRFTLIYDHLQQWDLTTPFDRQPTIDPFTGNEVGGIRYPFGDRLMRHITFGTEILLTDNMFVNIGYNYRRRQELRINDRPGTAGLSWGLGFRISKFNFAYGRATYHFAGPSNHFTITTRMSNW